MIPGGSAAQPLDAPYTYPVTEVYFDFENGVCKVAGVDADPYDLIDGLLPENITSAGLSLSAVLTAKGDLYRSLRNALTTGALIIVEYEARSTGSRSGCGVQWRLDNETWNFARIVAVEQNYSRGLVLEDGDGISVETGQIAYAGAAPSLGYVQRCAVAIGMTYYDDQRTRYWSVSMNGSMPENDGVPYRISGSRVKGIDLFNDTSIVNALVSQWYIRKFHVLPLPFTYGLHTTPMQTYSNRLLPVSLPSSSLGKDQGGKTEYRFGPFTLSESAAANRLVVAAIVYDAFDGSTANAATVTFDGVAAECVASNSQMEVWQLVVASGSSVSEIVITFAEDMKFCACKVFDFLTDNTVPHDAKAGSSSVGANVTLSDLAVVNGGRVLSMMKAAAADSSTTWTWGGSETPTVSNFNMKGTHAVSIAEIAPLADATTNDLICDAPAGATTSVYVMGVSWAPAAVANDPHWSNVKLLLGFNGADGATTFTAEEATPHALTFVGNAQLDTAQAAFGSASLLCDGAGDYVTTPDSDDWNFGNGAFTIEATVRFNATGTQTLVAQWTDTNPNRSWVLERQSSALAFFLSTTGSNGINVVSGSATIASGEWHHIRVTFDGVTYRIYLNGVQLGSSTTVYTIYNSTNSLSIGGKATSGAGPLNGWVDEVRVTKGVCRNPGLTKFRRPAAAYPRA